MFVIALAVTGVSTPWARRVAIALGFVDAPAHRKLHSTPMPLMGGLAIFLGALVAIAFLFQDATPIRAPQVRGTLLASGIIVVVGLIDDRRGLHPLLKLGGQLLGVAVLIFFNIHVRLPLPIWANYLITAVWLVGISNAINFLDNMDGLSAGISAVSAGFILLIAALNGQYLVGGVAAAVLGACVGFLRYNFRPAQIFMGDAGALFLGFLLAVTGLQLEFPTQPLLVTWMVPIFLLGVPIFDTSLVVISRLRRGVRPWTAGKDHASHRLVRLGMSQREAVMTLYLGNVASGMIAIFLTRANLMEGYFVAAGAMLTALYFIWQLETKASVE